MNTVSVAMATYNGAQYIEQQLESIATQRRQPAELVVSDDGSNDGTLDILVAFKKSSPFPVHIHRNEVRLGFRANFMRAANLCKSELISFCDQDDRWFPEKIAECVTRFTESDIVLVYHNADVSTDDGEQIGSLDNFGAEQPIMPPLSFRPMEFSPGLTQVFRRSLLRLSGLWPTSLDHNDTSQPMAHDQWFFFLASVFGKIAYVKEPLASYVQHGQNTFGWMGKPTKMGEVRLMFTNPEDQCSQYARATVNRVAVLEAAKTDLDKLWRERAELAAKSYRRMAEVYSFRHAIYRSPSFVRRLNAYRNILTRGGYSGRWSLGRRFFIQDTFIGVPLAPMLNRTNS